jgi:pyruvate dehydrogenase E1 component alpha subunit
MTEEQRLGGMMDRRRFLQLLGTAGATGAVMTACAVPAAPAIPCPECEACPEAEPCPECAPAAAAPEGFKPVYIHTEGFGGNPDWQPGDAMKFVPPVEIPDGPASDLMAAAPKELLLKTHERMLKSRRWEEAFRDLFVATDELYGWFHAYVGQEGVSGGGMAALRVDDFIASTHRGHGHLICKDGDLNAMSAEIYGKKTGSNLAYGGSMHITDMSKGILGTNGIVGAGFYITAGAAYGIKVRGTDQVAVCFTGDQATSGMYFWSSVRSAAMYNLPAIFVIENNFQGISHPSAVSVPSKQISDLVVGLDIPSTTVDGNNVPEMYATMKAAVDRARAGEGPSFIEAMCYRWYDHCCWAGAKEGVSGAFGLAYRSDEEVRAWMETCPIARYEAWLLRKGLATQAELDQISADVDAAVAESIEFGRAGERPPPEWGLERVFATGTVAATQFFNGVGIA